MGPYLMPHFDPTQIDQHAAQLARPLRAVDAPPDQRGGWGIYNIGPIPEGIVAWFIALAGAGDRRPADRGADWRGERRLIGRLVALFAALPKRAVQAVPVAACGPGGRPAVRSRTARRRHRRKIDPTRARFPPIGAPRRWWRCCCSARRCSASASPPSTSRDSRNTQLLGVAIGGALALLAAAAIIAGKLVVPQETRVEERGKLLDEERDRGGRRDDRSRRRGDLPARAADRRGRASRARRS